MNRCFPLFPLAASLVESMLWATIVSKMARRKSVNGNGNWNRLTRELRLERLTLTARQEMPPRWG
jgi:hypothetical protein